MKWLRLIVPVVLCLILAVAIVAGLFGRDSEAPRFVPVQTQPIGPFRAMYYDWDGDSARVRDGKMWFWTVPARTNFQVQQFLFDFNEGRVVGQLLNAVPMFANADQSKLLCNGFSGRATMKWKMYRWLQKFPFGRSVSPRINLEEPLWILDLRSNTAVRVGAISVTPQTGIHFVPSPGFRFGYENGASNSGEYVLCDLESLRLRKIKIAGAPLGWWDEQNILFLDLRNLRGDVGLFNIGTGATTTLVTQATISNFLGRINLPNDAGFISPMCHWNGREYDLLFTRGTGKSFLLKLERADLTLRLLYREFEYNPRGHLDNDCTHVLYDGEGGQSGKGGNGGFYLKNLTNNTTVKVVEPDNGGQYSIPRFYDGGVIYWRKKHLWRVDLNGSNNVPLISTEVGL